jgi:hypothetical protein
MLEATAWRRMDCLRSSSKPSRNSRSARRICDAGFEKPFGSQQTTVTVAARRIRAFTPEEAERVRDQLTSGIVERAWEYYAAVAELKPLGG